MELWARRPATFHLTQIRDLVVELGHGFTSAAADQAPAGVEQERLLDVERRNRWVRERGGATTLGPTLRT